MQNAKKTLNMRQKRWPEFGHFFIGHYQKGAMNMFKRNLDIREYKGKIPFWVIAEKMGIHETTLLYRMRKEMSQKEKAEIMAIIDQIEQEMHGTSA